MGIPIVKALSAHVLAQVACVSGETSDSNTHMVINVEDFLLVARQIMWGLLQRDKDLMRKWLNISWLTRNYQACVAYITERYHLPRGNWT